MASIPEVKYLSNFEHLLAALNALTLPNENVLLNAEEPKDSVLETIVNCFKEASCFGMKLKFNDFGATIRSTYMLTLSGFRFQKHDRDKAEGCLY